GTAQGFPVKSPQTFGELAPDEGLTLKSKETARGAVHVSHRSFGIQQDDALLQCLKDLFKKALFLDKPQRVPLPLRRLQAVHSPDDLVEETGFHDGRDRGKDMAEKGKGGRFS